MSYVTLNVSGIHSGMVVPIDFIQLSTKNASMTIPETNIWANSNYYKFPIVDYRVKGTLQTKV